MASRTTTDPIEILLEVGIDLDNLSGEEDYLSALMEAIAIIEFLTKGKGDRRSAILRKEVVRVRKTRKDRDTRFKAKKTTVSASSFKKGTATAGGQKALPSGIEPKTSIIPRGTFDKPEDDAKKKVKTKRETNKEQNLLVGIAKNVSSIVDILKKQYDLKKKSASYDRKQAEKEKRKLQESNLEKRFSGLKKIAEGVIAPVKSVLDRILDFFLNILIGRFLIKFIDWFADPKNKDKVDSIIRFLVDFGPKLLAAYLLFGTRLGRFVTRLSFALIKGAARLGMAAAKFAIGFARRNPAAAAITAIVGGAAIGGIAQSLTPSNDPERAAKGKTQLDDTQSFGGTTGAPISADMLGFTGGGRVNGAKGTDKIPAMLTDGEFVMSKGAVQKYGVDTLEAMNAAGGGTNQPKIVDDTVYASVGGYIGDKKDLGKRGTPDMPKGSPKISFGSRVNILKLSKDTMQAFNSLNDFVKFKFGSDINKKSTWGTPSIPRGSGSSGASTGSLLTDPFGAIARITSNMGIKTPNVSGGFKMPTLPSGSGGFKMPKLPSGFNIPKLFGEKSKPQGKSNQKGFFQELQEKLSGSGSSTYKDAGSIYARQMLGGLGGPISERDLSKESQAELQKAIQRAKKRTGSEIAKAEAKIKELRGMGAKDGNPALEIQKSFLKKLKAGGIRVQYTDYADEKGKMSESAKNAKNILGQFWATERSKKEGGGYKVEDKYDFDMFKKKDEKTGKMREMNTGELIMEGIFGKGKSVQQRLQAAYLLNPLRGKGDVDMVLGGKRTATPAKIASTPPKVSTPIPPPGGGSNVKVVRAPAPQSSQNSNKGSGSQSNAAPTGNGNKAKWNILGIPMPF